MGGYAALRWLFIFLYNLSQFLFVLLGNFGLLDLQSLMHVFFEPEEFLLLEHVQLRIKMFSLPQLCLISNFLQLNFRQQHIIALAVVHQQLALNRRISRLLPLLIYHFLIWVQLSHNQLKHRHIKPLILLQLIFQSQNLRKLPLHHHILTQHVLLPHDHRVTVVHLMRTEVVNHYIEQ